MTVVGKPSKTGRRELKREEGFESGATDALRRLQTALRALIETTPGVTGRPIELAQTLGVQVKLAWQAHRVAYAADPLTEACNVPGMVGMQRFLEAAARRGTPQDRIAAVLNARRELEDFIELHAGGRSEFDSMITALSDGGSEQTDLIHKRAAFRAQSHILGVQAKTHLACTIHKPSASDSERLDLVAIRGMIGLRRFRRDAAWIISQTRMLAIDGSGRRPVECEALDPAGRTESGVSLLSEFCSRPLPEIRRVTTDLEHMTNIEIVRDGVGNTSLVTCLVGDVFRRLSARRRSEHVRRLVSNVRVRTPCETLVHDVLLHESLDDLGGPELSIYSDHRDVDVMLENGMEARECDRLPLKESVVYLGKGPDVCESSDVPQYPAMLRRAMEQVGWSAREFKLFRCRVEYPVMPSSVVVTFDLPDGGG